MKTRIMLVDDHIMVSEVISALLERETDMEVVATADNGREAIIKAREVKPDIIVMDISMPELNGLEACRRIMAEIPESKIIVLSMHMERENVLEAIKAGAKGYIQKMSAFKTLVGAIRNMSGNNGYMDPNINDFVVYEQGQDLNKPGALYGTEFSSRKQQLLQLLAEGKKTREIACALKISHKTVEAHRRKISRKLGLGSMEDLTGHLNEMGVRYAQTLLSSREQEVLKLIAEGRNNKEIAFDLDISPKTIETYRRRIMQKLKLNSEADLTRYAIRKGIISL